MSWEPNEEVRRALERAGLPVPSGQRVTERGYDAREVDAIERYRKSVEATRVRS